MSGTSRRGLLKGALVGSVSLIGAQAVLGLPAAEAQETDQDKDASQGEDKICGGGEESAAQRRQMPTGEKWTRDAAPEIIVQEEGFVNLVKAY